MNSENQNKTDEIANELQIGTMIHRFARAIYEISKVEAYNLENNQTENNSERYLNSMYLHFLTDAAGQKFDDNSKILHIAHAAWSAIALLENELRIAEQSEIDDQVKSSLMANEKYKEKITDNGDVLKFS